MTGMAVHAQAAMYEAAVVKRLFTGRTVLTAAAACSDCASDMCRKPLGGKRGLRIRWNPNATFKGKASVTGVALIVQLPVHAHSITSAAQ